VAECPRRQFLSEDAYLPRVPVEPGWEQTEIKDPSVGKRAVQKTSRPKKVVRTFGAT
jgi:hypothetical protein